MNTEPGITLALLLGCIVLFILNRPRMDRFMDFVKVGVPFTLLVLVVSVVMVPWLFPL